MFTGGSLLYGSTGRPDLLGRAHAGELAHAQFASARRLAAELPQDADVYPTHGFGSFCSATQSAGTASTIGRERQVNPVLRLDEEQYVRELLAGLDAFPAYYAHMGPANAAGPAGPDLAPPRRADATELRRRIEAGEWVVDLRARRAFAAGHVAGTLSFDLDGAFATYLGWLIPWGTPLTLLGRTPEQVAEAQRELVRIGIDRLAAAAAGHPADWSGGRALRSYPVADFADLEAVRHHRLVVILDVRRDQEWNASHITGAVHIPIHQLPTRLTDVPEGEVWVHCEAGVPRLGRRVFPRRRRPHRRRRSTTSSTAPPARACPLTACGRSWRHSDSPPPASRKDAMSLMSALKKIFSRPYGKVSAADAAALAERGAPCSQYHDTTSTHPGRNGEPACAVRPSAPAESRSPGPAAAPRRPGFWPPSPRNIGAPPRRRPCCPARVSHVR